MGQSPEGRIDSLDLIRGVAVMMIASVNINVFAYHQAAYMNPAALGVPSAGDLAVWAANLLLVDGKFYALFAMMFGASMLLVVDRAEARGEVGWTVHWRRMAVLLAIGIAHSIFIWHGDILSSYAVIGLVAFLFRHSTVRSLVLWGVSLSLLNAALFAAIAATLRIQELAVASGEANPQMAGDWDANRSSFFPDPQAIATDQAIYDGSWTTIVGHQLDRWAQIPVNISIIFASTLGLMLLGMAAYRVGFLTGAWRESAYRRVAAFGIGIGLAAHVAVMVADLRSGFSPAVVLGGLYGAMGPVRIVQALGYAALFILLARGMGPIARRIAAVGRAAFTNYLGTSLVGAAIFYGWGFGLYGDLSRLEAWLLVPLLWLAMLAWSKPWLDRFNYGPLEWLWRSLARGRPQPMRRGG